MHWRSDCPKIIKEPQKIPTDETMVVSQTNNNGNAKPNTSNPTLLEFVADLFSGCTSSWLGRYGSGSLE
jgi:hypothetical protein